jgi:hypothetical protein
MAQLQIVDGRSAFNVPEVFEGVAGPVFDRVLPAVAAPVAADPPDAPPTDPLGAAVPAAAPLVTPATCKAPVCVAAAFRALNGAGVMTLVKPGNSSNV